MARFRVTTHGSGRPSLFGRIFMTLFALGLVVMGSVVAFLIARTFLRSLGTYSWREAECVITSSKVETGPGADETPRLVVEYRYVAFGREHTGNLLRKDYSGSSDVAETERLAARYAEGEAVTCYVDPEHPESATLERPSLLSGFWVLLPLVFVGVGVLMLVFAWHPSRRMGAGEGMEISISKRAKAGGGAGCLVGFFALFALAGAGTSLFFLIPAGKVLKARSWPAVPCTVESSRVAEHPGDDSTTYSVEVSYRYEIEGKSYRGNRYQFLGGSSSGYEGKQKVVDRYPAGSEAVCYVNPDDPWDAVMERAFTPGYFFALIPLLFFSVGVGGMVFALRAGTRTEARSWQPTPAGASMSLSSAGPAEGFRFGDGGPMDAGPVTLDTKSRPLGRFLGTLFVCCFWNGITGVFLWQVIQGWRRGGGDGCATLFLLPFVAIGLLLLIGVPHAFLALFNPRAVLTLSRAALPLGGSAELAWAFQGWPSRISRLVILIEAHEEATYGSGKQRSTSKSVFRREELVDTADPMSIASGRVTLAIPEDTMHSFESAHHKIVWTLMLRGTIRFWPDVGDEVVLTVTPPGGKP